MEINCTNCGKLALVRVEPLYEDFRKIGEAYVCTNCGHRYDSKKSLPVAEGDALPQFFDETEHRRTCRHCAHYVVNPFVERCGKTQRVTHATDTCPDFTQKDTSPKKRDALSDLFGD